MFDFLKEYDDDILDMFKTLINSCFDDNDKGDPAIVQELLHQAKNYKPAGTE